jgi:hypothetical protein
MLKWTRVSSTSGGRLVGVVRMPTKDHGDLFSVSRGCLVSVMPAKDPAHVQLLHLIARAIIGEKLLKDNFYYYYYY